MSKANKNRKILERYGNWRVDKVEIYEFSLANRPIQLPLYQLFPSFSLLSCHNNNILSRFIFRFYMAFRVPIL